VVSCRLAIHLAAASRPSSTMSKQPDRRGLDIDFAASGSDRGTRTPSHGRRGTPSLESPGRSSGFSRTSTPSTLADTGARAQAPQQLPKKQGSLDIMGSAMTISQMSLKAATQEASQPHQRPHTQSTVNPQLPEPVGVQRAREWSAQVENAFRVQEAGYRDLHELVLLGEGEPDKWPSTGFFKKIRTKESLGGASPSHLYFSQRRECTDSDLPRVKLYDYAAAPGS